MKSKSFVIGLLCIVLSIVCCVRCSVQSNIENAYISPAFKNVDVPYSQCFINASRDTTIKLASGTNIRIPARSFVDKGGIEVEGKISIAYREFHTAADIMISGMPMAYDSAGVEFQFETAGMFEINGFQDTSKIFIAKDKSITVDLKSQQIDNNYSFYELDTVHKNWKFLQNPKQLVASTKNDQILADLGEAPIKPVLPQKITKNTKLLDLNIDYSLYPELSSIQGIMWTYVGDNPNQDPQNNSWIYKTDWSNIILKASMEVENQYQLLLTGTNSRFETLIAPVVSEKDYDKIKSFYNDQFAKYQALQEKYEQQRKQATAQMNLIRSFEIKNFGIYNCDRLYNDPLVVEVNANFTVDNKPIEDETVTIYLITNNSVIAYYKHMWSQFKINPNGTQKIVAVFPNNKVAVFTSKEIKNLNLANPNSVSEQITFNLKSHSIDISKADDLVAIIKQL